MYEGDTTTDRSPWSGRPIVDWLDADHTLRDADGDEIGQVLEINPDFLVVEGGGGLLSSSKTWYVPRDMVRQEDTDWYLSMRRDDFEARDWSRPPERSQFAPGAQEMVGQPRHEGTRVLRWEEDVEARAVPREAGEVVVKKDVVEETRTLEVPVRREEVRVERRPVSGEATGAGIGTGTTGQEPFTGETIRVPVMEEQVEVRKVARPVEEIEISREETEDVRRVETTVRREQVDVQDERREP